MGDKTNLSLSMMVVLITACNHHAINEGIVAHYLDSLDNRPKEAAALTRKNALLMIHDLVGPLSELQSVASELSKHGCSRSSLSSLQNQTDGSSRPYAVVEARWTCLQPIDAVEEPYAIQFFVQDQQIAGALIVTPPRNPLPNGL